MTLKTFNLADLHPEARAQFLDLTALLVEAWTDGETEYLLRPFEGFRDSARQAEMVRNGTSKAGPFQSAHWFGLAVDFVPDGNTKKGYGFSGHTEKAPRWYWPPASHKDWKVLGEAAASVGLIQPISWDKPHVQHPLFAQMKRALRA